MNHTGPSDVLVLPPSLEAPISTDVAAPLARWLRNRHGDGSVLAPVWGGPFVLGETGLLTGRAFQTTWAMAMASRDRFLEPKLNIDRRTLKAGHIIPQGGVWAGQRHTRRQRGGEKG